ncbi:G-PROTEIN-RECEP-F1-2 domain-containing protein [Aphelenchoides bicaudatus]|nr:G-PROTEIN-RECEP-F1-2 domain-containing protein [Aphelenchoides bicaudatus]
MMNITDPNDAKTMPEYMFSKYYNKGAHVEVFFPAILLFCLMLVGYVGNSLIIWATFKNKALSGSCNYLLCMSVFGDILHQSAHWPYLIVTVSGLNFIPYQTCLYAQSIPQLGISFSIIMCLFVGIDRLIGVSMPTRYRQINTVYYMSFCIGVTMLSVVYFLYLSYSYASTPEGKELMVMCIIIDSLSPQGAQIWFLLCVLINIVDLIVYTTVWILISKSGSKDSMRKVFRSLQVIMFSVAAGWLINAGVMGLLVPYAKVPPSQIYFWQAYFGILPNLASSTNVFILYVFSQEYRATIRQILAQVFPYFRRYQQRRKFLNTLRREDEVYLNNSKDIFLTLFSSQNGDVYSPELPLEKGSCLTAEQARNILTVYKACQKSEDICEKLGIDFFEVAAAICFCLDPSRKDNQIGKVNVLDFLRYAEISPKFASKMLRALIDRQIHPLHEVLEVVPCLPSEMLIAITLYRLYKASHFSKDREWSAMTFPERDVDEFKKQMRSNVQISTSFKRMHAEQTKIVADAKELISVDANEIAKSVESLSSNSKKQALIDVEVAKMTELQSTVKKHDKHNTKFLQALEQELQDVVEGKLLVSEMIEMMSFQQIPTYDTNSLPTTYINGYLPKDVAKFKNEVQFRKVQSGKNHQTGTPSKASKASFDRIFDEEDETESNNNLTNQKQEQPKTPARSFKQQTDRRTYKNVKTASGRGGPSTSTAQKEMTSPKPKVISPIAKTVVNSSPSRNLRVPPLVIPVQRLNLNRFARKQNSARTSSSNKQSTSRTASTSGRYEFELENDEGESVIPSNQTESSIDPKVRHRMVSSSESEGEEEFISPIKASKLNRSSTSTSNKRSIIDSPSSKRLSPEKKRQALDTANAEQQQPSTSTATVSSKPKISPTKPPEKPAITTKDVLLSLVKVEPQGEFQQEPIQTISAPSLSFEPLSQQLEPGDVVYFKKNQNFPEYVTGTFKQKMHSSAGNHFLRIESKNGTIETIPAHQIAFRNPLGPANLSILTDGARVVVDVSKRSNDDPLPINKTPYAGSVDVRSQSENKEILVFLDVGIPYYAQPDCIRLIIQQPVNNNGQIDLQKAAEAYPEPANQYHLFVRPFIQRGAKKWTRLMLESYQIDSKKPFELMIREAVNKDRQYTAILLRVHSELILLRKPKNDRRMNDRSIIKKASDCRVINCSDPKCCKNHYDEWICRSDYLRFSHLEKINQAHNSQ